MKFLLRRFKKMDWVLIICAILLVIFGLVSQYSSSLGKDNFFNFKKQIVFFIIGIILMFCLSFFDYRILRNNSYLILVLYFLCLLLLAGLFIFAPQIRGVKAWYKLGAMSFDPIEPTKIVLIILLAKYFSMRHVEMYRFRHVIFSGMYVLLPNLLIFFQPNLGPVLIFLLMWLGILLISGIKIRHFIILSFCLVLILIISWLFLLKDYQKVRVVDFIFPRDPLGISWSQNQAKIAIGSGGLFGKGIGQGSQTQYGFLPEPHTDFIFSAIAEETGFVGVLVLFLLFGVLMWRITKIALLSQSNFPRLFASGFIIILFCQIFVHIGMNLGILPVIGIALPLVSYGGSGLLGSFVGLGLLQSIKSHGNY